jgi:hypothetical protein
MRIRIQSLALLGTLSVALSLDGYCEEAHVPELVLALEAEEPSGTVIDDLLARQDVWAYDLLARKVLPNKKLVAGTGSPAALVVAGVASHFGSTDAVATQLKSVWQTLNEQDRTTVLNSLAELYRIRPSGLAYYVMSQEQKNLLVSMMTPADWAKHGEILKELVGFTKAADNSADELHASLDALAKASPGTINSEQLGVFVSAAAALQSKSLDWQEVDVPLANAFAMLQKVAEVKGAMPVFDTQGLEGCLRALSFVRQRSNGAHSRALEAAERLTLSLVSGAGTLDLSDIAKDPGAHQEEHELRSCLVALITTMAKCRYTTSSSCVGSTTQKDYSRLPLPFSVYVATSAGAETEKSVREFVANSVKDSVKKCRAAVAEYMQHRTDRVSRKGMQCCLMELSELVGIMRPELLAETGVLQDVEKLLESAPAAEGEELRRSLSSWREDGHKDIPVDRRAEIAAAKKDYSAGSLELYSFIDKMSYWDALDDPFVYAALKKDVKGRRAVSNHLAICRIIGYSGTSEDSGILKAMTLEGRLDTYEAIMAAGQKRAYKDLMLMLLRFYPRSQIVERRRLDALLIGSLVSKEEWGQLIPLLQTEKDEKCAEYLALGVRRMCLEPQDGPAVLSSLAGTLKGTHYDQRWAYFAAVLRSLVPDTELRLCEGNKDKAADRNREIDKAVDVVLKRIVK